MWHLMEDMSHHKKTNIFIYFFSFSSEVLDTSNHLISLTHFLCLFPFLDRSKDNFYRFFFLSFSSGILFGNGFPFFLLSPPGFLVFLARFFSSFSPTFVSSFPYRTFQKKLGLYLIHNCVQVALRSQNRVSFFLSFSISIS